MNDDAHTPRSTETQADNRTYKTARQMMLAVMVPLLIIIIAVVVMS